jgi:heme exporter protein A
VSAISELLVENLALARGGRLLQPHMSFSVSAGEMLSVRGPNGAGKTSLLRALAGLLEIPHGSIVFRIRPDGSIADTEERLGKVGWLGHQDGIKRQLTLRENLLFHCRYNQSRGNAEEHLEALSLARFQDLPAQYLSHGQRRRLAFARLLVVPKSLWLLDEPFSAIDEKGKECVRRYIQQHCAKGGIVVAATHEPLGAGGATLELQ